MGEHRFLELLLDRVEVDVLDRQHRALPDRRHRLVGRIGLVDAQPDLPRIGDQPGLEQHFVRRVLAELGLLLLVGRDRFRVVHPGLDLVGGAHRGAPPQERREARKAEPGFIPQEDQIGLDGEAFLHHPAGVVDVAVEGAVGQVEHLDPVEPAVGLRIQQRLLDRLQRHRAIHRIFRHRERFDIERLRARQHHAVVVRLVAVAVDDRDVAGREQRLHRHLVRGRGAVGHEEDAIRAERARRLVLRLLDVAGRLQQAVEAAGGGAALGQEQVHAVEFAHVADPVRLEDGFAARDRQRMERPDRTLRIFLEIVEERRVVAVLDAFQDGEMEFQKLFDRIEDPPDHVGFGVSGHRLDVAIGHQIEIKLGAHPLDDMREPERGSVGLVVEAGRCRHGAQHRRVMTRAQRKAFVDDDGCDVGVEHRRAEGVLEAADDDRLIDERIDADAAACAIRLRGAASWWREAGDDQGLEIGPARLAAAECGGHQVRDAAVAVFVHTPVTGVLAEGARHQRLRDPGRKRQRRRGIAGGGASFRAAINCRPG